MPHVRALPLRPRPPSRTRPAIRDELHRPLQIGPDPGRLNRQHLGQPVKNTRRTPQRRHDGRVPLLSLRGLHLPGLLRHLVLLPHPGGLTDDLTRQPLKRGQDGIRLHRTLPAAQLGGFRVRLPVRRVPLPERSELLGQRTELFGPCLLAPVALLLLALLLRRQPVNRRGDLLSTHQVQDGRRLLVLLAAGRQQSHRALKVHVVCHASIVVHLPDILTAGTPRPRLRA